jgi:hypothetical protein
MARKMSTGGGIEDVIVYDNQGESFDRYTIFTPDGSVYGMSENASGFNMYIGDDTEIEKGTHLGKRLKSVPKSIQKAVIDRMNETYAKGGMTEHGLEIGDEIMGYTKKVNELHVVNRKNNDEWHSVDLDDGKRYAGGGGVDYPNHYLEVEDLNRKINALTQQIEADYRNDEIDAYTDRNERELEKLIQKREFLMYGKDSYSTGGGVSGLDDLIRG